LREKEGGGNAGKNDEKVVIRGREAIL